MSFKIDEKLAQEILNYLSNKPYKEVFTLVLALMNLEKLEDKKDK